MERMLDEKAMPCLPYLYHQVVAWLQATSIIILTSIIISSLIYKMKTLKQKFSKILSRPKNPISVNEVEARELR